jgi:hypothetical protein
MDQAYNKVRLIRSLKKIIFRYQDLVEKYSVSAETIINYGFSLNMENVNQLRNVNTICRRSWYIDAHVWKISDIFYFAHIECRLKMIDITYK